MYKNILLFSLLFFPFLAMGQPCGTVVTPENIERLRSLQSEFRNFERYRSWTRTPMYFPIQFHIIRSDYREYGLDESILPTRMRELNEAFRQANIRFIQHEPPKYIDDSEFVEYNFYWQEDKLATNRQVKDVINVFCVPKMVGEAAAYAYQPDGTPQSERVFIANEYMLNSSTFIHELGHTFGLYHTFGKTNTGRKEEYVSRTRDADNNGVPDCEEKGDDCCDTPADPGVQRTKKNDPHYYLPDCSMSEHYDFQDPEGYDYEPMMTNYMSYNPHKDCRNIFTPDQYDRMEVVASKERYNLKLPDDYRPEKCAVNLEGTVAFKLADQSPMNVRKDKGLYRFIDSYQSGDTFTFSATNDADIPVNLYILNMDARKEVLAVFPYYAYEKPTIQAGGTYDLGSYITLSGDKGKEYACLLYTEEILDLNQVVNQIAGSEGTFTQRLYAVLGDKLLPINKVNYEEGTKVQFEGCLAEGEILPVMLEMDKI